MLIWNDPLSSPRFNDGDLPLVGRRQLADITAFSSEEAYGLRGFAPYGRRLRRPWTPYASSDIPVTHATHVRAAKTTDDRGRFDDESR